MSAGLYIGLMTGTSLDAADAVVARFTDSTEILASSATPLPAELRERLRNLIDEPGNVNLDELGAINRELADVYAAAVNSALDRAGLTHDVIDAIGCHGQTVRHCPEGAQGFSMQLGDGAALAVATGIDVVTDFRSADIALGGQGAPLVPAFHQYAFGADKAIINIGGIANITILSADGEVTGYDTGPGNTLMDCWCEDNLGNRYDASGDWAASGNVDHELLDSLLSDDYFERPAPKSTGREYFNSRWLQGYLDRSPKQHAPADVQATLLELTSRSIALAITETAVPEVYLCGGGAANSLLVSRIADSLPDMTVQTTATIGIPIDQVEATAFAWLARARLEGTAGNVPSVTGASRPAILGAIYAKP